MEIGGRTVWCDHQVLPLARMAGTISRPSTPTCMLLALAPMLIGMMGLVAALIGQLQRVGFSSRIPNGISLLHWKDMASYLPLV